MNSGRRREMTVVGIHEVLIDARQSRRVLEWNATSSSLLSDSPLRSDYPWRIQKTVLHGGRQEGVDLIRVDNGVFRFLTSPTRGMSLWDGRVGELRLGWDSPVKEIVHPQYVHLSDQGGLGWLQGFNEWLNRCGLAWNGAPGVDQVKNNTGTEVPVDLTLHGRASYLPATYAEVRVDVPGPAAGEPRLTVRGVVDETMMYGTQLRLTSEISTLAGSRTITIKDTVENLSSASQEFQLLYHTNFGPPLLEEGAQLVAACKRVTPRDAHAARSKLVNWSHYEGPTPGFIEQVYFVHPCADPNGETEVLLRNREGSQGVSMRFSLEELPYLTVWKNTQAVQDGYVTGIEPATNFPNPRSFERAHGRVPVLEPGAVHEASIQITALTNSDQVAEAHRRVLAIQGDGTVVLDPKPLPKLCP